MRLIGAVLGLVISTISFDAHAERARELVRNADARGLPELEVDLTVASPQRFALVIGNSDYQSAEDLPNARSDAALVASLFRDAGFTVAEHHNLSKKGFETALRETLHEVDFGAEFAFYYAGHGVQVGDGNFLIPTDLSGGSVHDVRMGTVSLASILGLFSSRTRSVFAVLDSCRNNPFPDLNSVVSLDETPKPLQTGFVAPTSPINSLVVFSTSPGSVALDGRGENSPFTRAFVENLRANPQTPVDELMKKIRRNVYVGTGKLQVPWSSSSLVERIVLGKIQPGSVRSIGEIDHKKSDRLRLDARLDRKIDIGKAVASLLQSDTQFSVIEQPRSGRLEIIDNGKYQSILQGQALPIEKLSNVVFAKQFSGLPSDLTSSEGLDDTFKILVGAASMQLDLRMKVDPCDFHAGDHLDPDGVGIERYPNEIEPIAALSACRTALEKAPAVGRFQYQLGRAHLALKDFEAARFAFKRATELGHARAYHGLGTLELASQSATFGQTRKAASEKALNFFREGVRRGDPYAYHSLGLQLLKFPQSPNDRLNGFELLSRALELGHTFSMNALGLYFLEEEAAHYDAARGLRYLEESAARGDIYGYANLGYIALRGAGETEKDFKRAEALFRRASDGGHPAAASSIGRMHVNGQIGPRKDLVQAIKWYDLGLSRGDAWGGANAAWIIINQSPLGFTSFDAATRAAKAATMGNAQAAKAARQVLDALSLRALAGGAQAIMQDLGADITVDGVFGPSSRNALRDLSAEHGHHFTDDPKTRILELAKLFWVNTKFRVDLY